jgi:hypothetical protein
MINTTFESVQSLLYQKGIDLEKVERFYPRLNELTVPLSASGVTPRNFAHWKKAGLIDYPAGSDRTWVRLNLFQFVWLKVISVLRDFGLPLPAIVQVKELLFEDLLSKLSENRDDYRRFLKENSNTPAAEIETQMLALELSVANQHKIPDDLRILLTPIASITMRVLLLKEQSAITIHRSSAGLQPGIISDQTRKEFPVQTQEVLSHPHIQIPLYTIIADFFFEDSTATAAEIFGLINPKEASIIAKMKNNEFKSLLINVGAGQNVKQKKFSPGKNAEENTRIVRRILGMNEFIDLTLTDKNGKETYLKSKSVVY